MTINLETLRTNYISKKYFKFLSESVD